MKIFIGLLCCLFFGARVCSGVPKASSDANQQVLTGSDDKVSQLLLDVFKKRVNESEWDGEGLYHSDIEESNNQGLQIVMCFKQMSQTLHLVIVELA